MCIYFRKAQSAQCHRRASITQTWDISGEPSLCIDEVVIDSVNWSRLQKESFLNCFLSWVENEPISLFFSDECGDEKKWVKEKTEYLFCNDEFSSNNNLSLIIVIKSYLCHSNDWASNLRKTIKCEDQICIDLTALHCAPEVGNEKMWRAIGVSRANVTMGDLD